MPPAAPETEITDYSRFRLIISEKPIAAVKQPPRDRMTMAEMMTLITYGLIVPASEARYPLVLSRILAFML